MAAQKSSVKNLKEVIAEIVKKYEEDPCFMLKGEKVRKNLNQCIPYTAEQWEKEMENQQRYKDRKRLTNYIDKVFFEDGALFNHQN